LPLAVLHCLPQFHISGRLLDLCAGGLSPGRIQLGNPCSSAHLARGPPNRRDGRAIAASISTINPRVRHEQDKRRSGSTFCAGYSPFPQDQPNAVINADWLPDEVQSPAACLLNPGTTKRPPALGFSSPDSQHPNVSGASHPVRQRTGVQSPKPCRMDRGCRCQWSSPINLKLTFHLDHSAGG
jgi:hypothetical protein